MAVKFLNIGKTIFLSNQNMLASNGSGYFRMLFEFNNIEYCYYCNLRSELLYSNRETIFEINSARKVWKKLWF